jgi:arginase family enzyme
MKDWSNQKLELQGPLYITLDMDAFDPGFAPGVSHHEPGGFTPRQVIQLIQNIDVPVIGGDIVEYNPARDIHDMTAALSAKLLKEIAAKIIS